MRWDGIEEAVTRTLAKSKTFGGTEMRTAMDYNSLNKII